VRGGAHPSMALLAQLAGVGAGSAWPLVRELFGWWQFRNRREVAELSGPDVDAVRQRHQRG
jgi:transposase